MRDVLAERKIVLIGRAILSFFVLVIFLLLPTMWLRSRFALAVAKLPVWKQYEFFTAMFTIIKEDDKGRDNDIKSGEKV